MAGRDRQASRRQALAEVGLSHHAPERVDYLGAVVRIHDDRVLAVHRHVAHRAGPARCDQRQAGRRALAQRHPERLVAAHERQHVGVRVHLAELPQRGRARKRHRHSQPPREGAQLGFERPGPADLELGLSLGEAGLGERVDQDVEVLVRHQPADGQHPHRPAGRACAPGSRRVAERVQVRALERYLHERRRDPQPPQALHPLRARHDEPVHPRRQHSVHAALKWRQCAVAPRRELAEDEQRHALPARPSQCPHRGGAVFPAHDAIRPRLGERATDPQREHHRGPPRPPALPRWKHLARVLVRAGEPARRLVPAGLARGQVDDVRIHTTALRKAAKQRLPVGNWDRRQDRYARWHAATLPHGAGRKRLGMHTTRRESGCRASGAGESRPDC